MTSVRPKYTGTLSAADVAQAQAAVEHWMGIGLSTARCDRPAAEAAVRHAYETAGFEPPKVIVWMDSPLGGCLASAVLAAPQLGDQLRDQLRDQLWDQLWDQLRDQLGGQLRDQLGYELSPWWEPYWIALYSLALDVAGLEVPERLQAMANVTAQVGWWWPRDGAVVLTDRPTQLHRDALGRLHRDGGPALAYADGYALHAWHGVRVPASLVTEDWPLQAILSEPNTEIRRCAIERMGWDRFVPEAGLVQVGATVPDPGNPGHELALYDVPEQFYDEPIRVLLCTNGTVERDGTRRRFGLTVPADIPDPVAAAAWGYDDPSSPVRVTPQLYGQLARRT